MAENNGPWHFAYCDADEVFNSAVHLRWDENIFAMEYRQNEGEAATLSILILNPGEGILNEDRQQHCMMAYVDPETEIVYHFFKGRVDGVPEELNAQLISLRFTAISNDFFTQKVTLANALKSLPAWDPVFIDPSRIRDPDAILEARSELFHVHPTTHEVTLSDILQGEDGTVSFGPEDMTYDDLSASPDGVAAKSVSVQARVNWTQAAAGLVDIAPAISYSFINQSGAGSWIAGAMSTFTPDGLLSNYPVPGDNIGGGWSVSEANVSYVPVRNSPFLVAYARVPSDQPIGEVVSGGLQPLAVSGFGIGGGTVQKTVLNLTNIIPTLVLKFDVRRSYEEIIRFTMYANVQDVRTDASVEEEAILLDLSSNDISEPVDAGDSTDEIPIGDLRRTSYFKQDRGRQSFHHLLLRARATLRVRSRVVNLSLSPIDFKSIFNVTLRKNVHAEAETLNGGEAIGKVTSVHIACDGNSGTQRAYVNAGCAIGKGGVEEFYPSSNGYVDPGYVEDGYVSSGSGLREFIEGELTYEDYAGIPTNDDGINFFNLTYRDVVNSVIITNGMATQMATIGRNSFHGDLEEAQRFLKAQSTKVCIDMLPLEGGPFTTEYDALSPILNIPKQYDLQASGA